MSDQNDVPTELNQCDNSITAENNYVAYSRPVVAALRGITKIRPLTYASEVAESGRQVIPGWVVKLGYGLSLGYVAMDIGVKLHDVAEKGTEDIKWKALDLSLWHASASIVAPGMAIHTIVRAATFCQNKFVLSGHKLPRHFKFFPTLIGLVSIPFIIHPIDHGTDFVMDNTIRKYYTKKTN